MQITGRPNRLSSVQTLEGMQPFDQFGRDFQPFARSLNVASKLRGL
jgi:hypothetical protein